VVHINFGKTWGRALSAADPEKYWVEGRRMADRMLDRMSELSIEWGGSGIEDAYRQRVYREFESLRPNVPEDDDPSEVEPTGSYS
jgi:hypothetical protein